MLTVDIIKSGLYPYIIETRNYFQNENCKNILFSIDIEYDKKWNKEPGGYDLNEKKIIYRLTSGISDVSLTLDSIEQCEDKMCSILMERIVSLMDIRKQIKKRIATTSTTKIVAPSERNYLLGKNPAPGSTYSYAQRNETQAEWEARPKNKFGIAYPQTDVNIMY